MLGIQQTLGRAVLRRNTKKLSRKRFIHNLDTAKSVGVVFSPGNQQDLNNVKQFLGYLINLGIKVIPLAFIDNKRIMPLIITEKNINCVTPKDFNWFHKPLSPVLKNFIHTEFDILINLCLKNSLPVNFIVGQSRASLKTGKFFENDSFCDLMIDIKDSNDLSLLIENTSHYLSVINNSN